MGSDVRVPTVKFAKDPVRAPIASMGFDRNYNSSIYVFRPATSRLTKVSTSTAKNVLDQEPAVSPDGQRIVFLRITGLCRRTCPSEGLWVVSAHGRHQHRIAAGEFVWPSWSPHGARIAAAARRHNRWQIAIMNADGSHLRYLKLPGLRRVDTVNWSPDGRHLVLTGQRRDRSQIFTVRSNGTGLTQLTHGPGYHTQPDWSPGGKAIVYIAGRVGRDGITGRTHLMRMNTDGSDRATLTSAPASRINYPEYDRRGNWILYQRGMRRTIDQIIHPNGADNHTIQTQGATIEPNWPSP